MPDTARARVRRAAWLPLLIGAAVLLGWAAVAGWPPPVVAVDINQHRADSAPVVPNGEVALRQTFVAQRDGLQEIELLLARYDSVPANPGAQFIIQLRDDANALIVQEFLAAGQLSHNERYTVRFAPQPDSAERIYTLTLRGQDNTQLTAWGAAHDVYAGGALTQPDSDGPADLRFVTRYRLTLGNAIPLLAAMLSRDAALLLTALFFVPLPGALLWSMRVAWRHRSDTATETDDAIGVAVLLGVWLALGVALWALLWQWLTVINQHWQPGLLWATVVIGWTATVVLLLWARRRGGRIRPKLTFHWQDGALFALLALAFAVRLLAVRDLAFPAWVDASRHALITTLMAQSGAFLLDYAPLLPVSDAPYHYGFHTLSAGLVQLLGHDPARVLLIFGQLLNAWVVLAVYAGGWFFTRRRNAALVAAFLVALPLFFPAYYVSWGRYTQLAGMLVLSVLAGVTWRVCAPGATRRPDWWGSIVIGVLSGGLFLVHVRVFLLYLPLAVVIWTVQRGRGTLTLLAGGFLGALLAAPQLIRLAPAATPEEVLSPIPGYNAFPTGYVTVGWERQLYAAAAVVAVTALIAGVAAWRTRRHQTADDAWFRPILALAIWVGVLFLLLAGDRIGLPESWLLNLNAMVITLFLPVAVSVGAGAAALWRWLRHAHWLLQIGGYAVAGALIASTVLFGVQRQVSIVNDTTILAAATDRPAIAWVDAHLPPDAHIAVSAWQWLGQAWAGHDAGAWLLPLTGRSTTTPPVDYIYNRELAVQVAAFNQAAQQVTNWAGPDVADWLRQQGVTHVFVGARGGVIDERALLRNPDVTLLYSRDGAFIFAVDPP